MQRRPKGYVGRDHETVGSDVLAVLQAASLPRTTLGADKVSELEAIQPDQWYPISVLLDLMERLYEKAGPAGLRRMGRALFRLSHGDAVGDTVNSARDVVYGIDVLYRNANRGEEIGGWTVLEFEPGRAELRKTTPHHCVMEEGILAEALKGVGVSATITQSECFREGDAACRFVIESTVTDERWTGTD